MEKCLLTQFKQAASNSDLPYYGEAEITLNHANSGYIKVNPGQTAKLIPVAGGSAIDLSDSQQLDFADISEETVYRFISKYSAFPYIQDNLANGVSSLNISQWKDAIKPERIFIRNSAAITIADLPSSETLHSLNLYQTPCTGTLQEILTKYPNIGNNGEVNIYATSSNLTGSISDLAALKYIPNNVFYINAYITGDFKDAIVGWRTNIGQTGTMPKLYCGSGVHLWSVYPSAETLFAISWTATTMSITVGGVTTTFDNNGNIVS